MGNCRGTKKSVPNWGKKSTGGPGGPGNSNRCPPGHLQEFNAAWKLTKGKEGSKRLTLILLVDTANLGKNTGGLSLKKKRLRLRVGPR